MAVIVVEGRLAKHGEWTKKDDLKKYAYLQIDAVDGTEVRVDKVSVVSEVDALVDPGVSGRFVFTKYPVFRERWLMGLQADDGRSAIHPFARSRTRYLAANVGIYGFVGFLMLLLCLTPFIIIGLPMLIGVIIVSVTAFRDTNALFEELGKLQASRKTVEI